MHYFLLLSWLFALPQFVHPFLTMGTLARSSPDKFSIEAAGSRLRYSMNNNGNNEASPVNHQNSEESTAGAYIQRMALRQIFDSERNYIFTTKSNIRDYEWEKDTEVEDLLEGLLELEEVPVRECPAKTLELHLVTILQLSKSSQDIEKLGGVEYDVFDGQQRIITVCLLIAAMRDAFVHEWKQAPYSDRVMELSKAIYPTKADPPEVARIRLRSSNCNELLGYILSKKDEFGQEAKKLKLPKSNQRRPRLLSAPEQRIVENYRYLLERIIDMGQSRTEMMWSNLRHRTYFLVCIPANARIARSMVLGLAKGKNIEPIDEFKQIVCYNQRDSDAAQDETLAAWNDLADNSNVGRKVVEAACLIFAQINLKRAVVKHREVDLMEEFFSDYLAQNESRKGSDFFGKKIVPVARTLRDFRDGHLVVPITCQYRPSMNFLSQVVKQARAKQIELLVILFLVEAADSQGTEVPFMDESLCKNLCAVERLAIWMLTAKTMKASRYNRCWAIIRDRGASNLLELSLDEKAHVMESLDVSLIGSKSNSTIAKLILERLNEYQIGQDNDAKIETDASKLQLEHVLPQTPDKSQEWTALLRKSPDDVEEWIHRLGNLAILNKGANIRMGNGPFHRKKDILKHSPYPLTRRIAEYSDWDEKSIQNNHLHLLGLCREVWKL